MNALLARAIDLALADSPSARTICIDFDGVIHPEGPWNGGRLRGAPLPGAVERIRALLDGGWRIVVFTARASEYHEAIADYLGHYLDRKVIVLPGAETAYWETEHQILVTNVKPGAFVYVDDKGEEFKSWDTALVGLPDSPDDLLHSVVPLKRQRRWWKVWWRPQLARTRSPRLPRQR
ncbi:hypothetical protein ACGF12_13730 [Kitasatospora sp. NPDC048296]|uniref:hypothetical protein n=1 Tax=Kitasatospora sp. NPDC048296 TaxID=3364048 RepID=UPI00371DF98D